jgi:nucleolar protein 14
MVRDAHFGGGIFERKRPAAEGDAGGEDGVAGGEDAPERRRSKKEVMEEVMAKSKAYKAQRQAVRQEDVEATDALAAAWHALASSGALAGALRPQGAKPEAAAGGAAAADEDRRFDALTRELLYEGKAQPGERTLAPAELADMERARLEALEAARLKRQRVRAVAAWCCVALRAAACAWHSVVWGEGRVAASSAQLLTGAAAL